MKDIKYITENGEKIAVIPMTCYRVCGNAFLKVWGGGQGYIDMKPFALPPNSKLTDEEIFEKCNDSGFGCEKILGAYVQIFENYGGHETFVKDCVIDNPAFKIANNQQISKNIEFVKNHSEEIFGTDSFYGLDTSNKAFRNVYDTSGRFSSLIDNFVKSYGPLEMTVSSAQNHVEMWEGEFGRAPIFLSFEQELVEELGFDSLEEYQDAGCPKKVDQLKKTAKELEDTPIEQGGKTTSREVKQIEDKEKD